MTQTRPVAWLIVVGLSLLLTSVACALDSQMVFERNENALFQIRVINRETEKKTSIGSGFVYGNAHQLVTNYHVVSQYIEKPDTYELRYLATDGSEGPLELKAVDAVPRVHPRNVEPREPNPE